MKRMIALIAIPVLALGILSGCGKADEKATPDQANQSQPAAGKEQAADPNDPLAQFPPVKLGFKVDNDAAVVEYQGGKLTGKEFTEFLQVISFLNPPQRQAIEAADQETLKNYAREYTATKILASRADDAVRKQAETDSATSFERVKGQYLSLLGADEKKFDTLMKNHGLTKEQVIKQMSLINASIGVLKKDIKDADLQKQYEQADKANYTTASVRHILISTESRKPEEALKLANDLVARLKKGEDFAALAKQYTDDPGSKESGGLYENADVTQWVPEFKEAALKQPVGQVGEPVKTDFGYHIIRVEDRKVKTFEEAKESMRQQTLEVKYGEFVNAEMEKLVTKWNIPKPTPAS